MVEGGAEGDTKLSMLQEERSIPEAKTVSKLGFWSAVFTAVMAGAFFLLGIMTPARSGPFCSSGCIVYPYVGGLAPFIPVDYIWLYPGILLAPVFVSLMASIHRHAMPDKKVFSEIGLLFSVIYAAVIIVDYFVQFAVIEPSILAGETSGLSLFTQYNPHGLFIALEAVGYLMMSAAFFSIAPVFGRGRPERAVRWLYVASFALEVSAFTVFSLVGYDIVTFEVTILMINWTALIASGILLSLLFRRSW
jgi:hypothetical protein